MLSKILLAISAVQRIQNFYGYYNDKGEYIENGTHEITSYRYAHNPMELYELNQNQPALRLEAYEAPYFEQACYELNTFFFSP